MAAADVSSSEGRAFVTGWGDFGSDVAEILEKMKEEMQPSTGIQVPCAEAE